MLRDATDKRGLAVEWHCQESPGSCNVTWTTKESLLRSNATELVATSGMDCVIENHLSLWFRQVVAETDKGAPSKFP
jgi:hypothetical protein